MIAAHVHRWLLASPSGAERVLGHCRCGAVRSFAAAWHEPYTYRLRGVVERARAAAERREGR